MANVNLLTEPTHPKPLGDAHYQFGNPSTPGHSIPDYGKQLYRSYRNRPPKEMSVACEMFKLR